MIGQMTALLKREIWEHRSIYVTPVAIASIVTLGTLAALIFAGGFAKELDLAIFGATNLAGDAERRVVLTGFFIGTSWLFLFAAGVLTIFLHARFAVRRAQGQKHPVLAVAADHRRGGGTGQTRDRVAGHSSLYGCCGHCDPYRQPDRHKHLG